MSAATSITAMLVQSLSVFLGIYLAMIFIRILLSWFPNVDWSNPAISALTQMTDPYLGLFRSIIPPIGGLDLSAMLATFALWILFDFVSAASNNVAAAFVY
ncbi:MAG: YggT family protein [Phormidesmis sp. RL_2_1]|nr:YggT family protein [Phormidesmis sp. RL_2_1]